MSERDDAASPDQRVGTFVDEWAQVLAPAACGLGGPIMWALVAVDANGYAWGTHNLKDRATLIDVLNYATRALAACECSDELRRPREKS